MHNQSNRFRFLIVLTFIIFVITLFYGLRGKDFHFLNDVRWMKNEAGIRFGSYGIVYALIDNDQIKNTISKIETFSFEIAIKPEKFDLPGFNVILSLHDGQDSNQLIIGQWKSSIIVMNGDDYSRKRKTKRIEADIFSDPQKKLFLTVTTGSEGTKLFFDGRLIETKSNLILKIPKGNMISIALGNSVYGQNPWRGDIYGLAFYANRLETETIENHFKDWSKNQIIPLAEDKKPFLFLTFNEREGTEIIDHISAIQKLNIPTSFHILKKRFFSPPWQDFEANRKLFIDLTVNLVGFVPLGFILYALLIESGGVFHKKAILFSIVLCFLISLSIEIAQAWIPSRSSQMLDLMFNTTGAIIGAIFYKIRFEMRKCCQNILKSAGMNIY